MSRAAGRVDDGEAEQRFDRSLWVLRDGVLDDGLEGTIEQYLHETVGGVVAAGGLARIALRLAASGKRELPSVLRDLRDKFEQALVNTTELLGSHIAPVHACQTRVFAQPSKLEHREQERAVLELRSVERGALGLRKDASKRWKSEPRFARSHTNKDDLGRLPEIREAIVCAALHRALAQALQAVALGIEVLRLFLRAVGMQETALLDGEQEDEPVDEPQELVEVVLRGEYATLQCGPERLVVRVRQEALA